MDAVSLLPERLVTDRLVVRRARAGDGPALAKAMAETLDDLLPWFRWAEPLKRWGTVEDYGQRASLAEQRHEAGLDPTWFLWRRDAPDELVGEVALKTEGFRFGVFSYTVWVRRSAMGRGYAGEASRALFDAAFRSGRADHVEAECAFANFRSRRLLVGLGFAPWGATRDHQRYVLDAY